uniref:Putative salivary secreted peptide n=2 Tax=Ixodes ricinus TaxID=34613 RepID=V5IBI8_IXORI
MTGLGVSLAIAALWIVDIAHSELFYIEEAILRFRPFQLKKHNQIKVKWWDITGTHEELSKDKKYEKYRMKVSVKGISYGEATSKVAKPDALYSQTFQNNQKKTPISVNVQHIKTVSNFLSWEVENSVRTGLGFSMFLDLPKRLGDAGFEVSTAIDSKNERAGTEIKTTEVTMKESFSVPGQTEVTATWKMTDGTMNVPWTADFQLEGFIAVYYERQYKSRHLWFYSIAYLNHPKLTRLSKYLVKYEGKGVFNGVTSSDLAVQLKEKSLKRGKKKPSENVLPGLIDNE